MTDQPAPWKGSEGVEGIYGVSEADEPPLCPCGAGYVGHRPAEPVIHKTTITVTIFSRDRLELASSGDSELWEQVEGWIHDSVEGDKIGDWGITAQETVQGDQLKAELVAIGNDGDFFDDIDPWWEEHHR
jgi:hypothetical protein